MAEKRQYYRRPKKPKNIRLTERDQRIMETLHAFDGMMSYQQLKRLFFPGKWDTGPKERLRLLFQHRYLNLPDDENLHRVPQGEIVYWLDEKGAELVAGLRGLALDEFSWRPMGRWSRIAHDLAVNDFRLDIMDACEEMSELTLFDWVVESEFTQEPDTITYTALNGAEKTRQVRPDGFFLIRKPSKKQPGKQLEYAFLLEIDMGTESNVRFARDKVASGTLYLSNESYQERFGVRYGRWLVVTTNEGRMIRMKDQVERFGGGGVWYFTTFDRVAPATVLTDPIWLIAGQQGETPLIRVDD